MSKKVIVIGAGISGMIAGVYARKAGFDVEMYEAHKVAGGLCTGWHRQGYDIDGCIQWMTGSKPGSDLYRIWETCGALGGDVEVHYHDYMTAVRDGDHYNYLYSDIEKLEAEFLSLSPEDARRTHRLMSIIRAYQKMPIPARKPNAYMSLLEMAVYYWPYAKALPYIIKSFKTTIGQYIEGFRSPKIRRLLSSIISNYEMNTNALFFTLGTYTKNDGGWPKGGSYAMAQRMRERFQSMGGLMYLNSPVEKIMVRDGKAVGIVVAGKEIAADYVITAVSPDMLLERLLEGRYRDAYFEKRYARPEAYPVLSSTVLAFGVNACLDHYPHNLYIQTSKPIQINKTEVMDFSINHYGYDPKFSNEGKSLVIVLLNDPEIDYWRRLKNLSVDDYHKAKADLAATVLAEIETRYPEVKGKVEMTDVATPLTFERYCNTYRGSYMAKN